MFNFPQMYPINWIFMFMFFSSIFYLFLSFVYFFKPESMKVLSKKMNKIDSKVSMNSWKNCW